MRWDGESVARIRIDDRYHGKTKGTFLWATDRYRYQVKQSIFFMADIFCLRTGGMQKPSYEGHLEMVNIGGKYCLQRTGIAKKTILYTAFVVGPNDLSLILTNF